jgi:hypothetical protein
MAGLPRNLVSKKTSRGINPDLFLLSATKYVMRLELQQFKRA